MKTFPKNIRQIGEPGAGRKILIEDYVYTYLRQLAEDDLTCMKTAVLLGSAEDGRSGEIYLKCFRTGLKEWKWLGGIYLIRAFRWR